MAPKTYTWQLLDKPGGPTLGEVTWTGEKATATAPNKDAAKAIQAVVNEAKTAVEAYASLQELAEALESPIEGPAPKEG